MLFVEKEIRREDQALAYAPVILLHIILFFSVPDETEVDLRRIRSLCTLSLFAGYRKGKPAQITLLLEHWELLF